MQWFTALVPYLSPQVLFYFHNEWVDDKIEGNQDIYKLMFEYEHAALFAVT